MLRCGIVQLCLSELGLGGCDLFFIGHGIGRGGVEVLPVEQADEVVEGQGVLAFIVGQSGTGEG